MTALDTVQHICNPEWACWAPENHFGECCSVNRSTLGAVQVLDPAPGLPFRNPHCAAPFCIRNAVAACSRRRRQGRWPAPADGPPCRRCHQARSPWRRAGTSNGSALPSAGLQEQQQLLRFYCNSPPSSNSFQPSCAFIGLCMSALDCRAGWIDAGCSRRTWGQPYPVPGPRSAAPTGPSCPPTLSCRWPMPCTWTSTPSPSRRSW